MRILLLLLCLGCALSAQEKKRTCRILFPGGPELAAEKYYLFDGQNCQEVALPRLSLSPIFKLRPGNIKIHLLSSPVGKPEEVPPGAPEATVLADVNDLYLIISRDPDNSVLPLRMGVINANFNQIGRGEMLWINLTHKHLAGTIGKSSLNLPGNKTVLVNEPATVAGDYPVEIYFRVPDDVRNHPLIETQWRHDTRSRYIVFVYDEGRRRAPRVMSFSDFRMPEPEEGQ